MTYAAVHANNGNMQNWSPVGTLDVGKVYEFTVNGAGAHPYHIHINPFQITTPGANYGGGYFQTGDWHDTLMINELGGGGINVRMNVDTFTGKMVCHCHILEHEDEGMMGWIEIAGTDGATWSGAAPPNCYAGAYNSG